VRSLPDGVAQLLAEYFESTEAQGSDSGESGQGDNGFHLLSEAARSATAGEDNTSSAQQALRFGDLCPECGQAAVVNEEGCRKCYACGFSEC
jgi:ribonucleoside-diphosphate reductase alpha chain